MYPRISDFINEVFGTSIQWPVQTYGFFVALAFLVAAWLSRSELKRKERMGLLKPFSKTIIKGKPASAFDLIVNGLVGFILGFKGIAMVLDYSRFVDNPQDFILSGEGSITGGLLAGAGLALYTWYIAWRQQLPKPVSETLTVYPHELTVNMAILAGVSGIAGAKLFDILEHPAAFFSDPIGTIFSFQGLTFFGGLIVAAFVLILYAKRNNIPWPVLVDSLAPALMLAYAIGRLGCHFSGDGCWGIPNTNPKPEWLSFLPDWLWAFDFPHNVINEGIPIHDCAGRHCRVLPVPVYPTSFYESAMASVLFIVLWVLRKPIHITGWIFSIYLIMSGVERFLIEKIRVNPKMSLFGLQFTQAELISVLLIIAGLVGFYYFWRNRKKYSLHQN